MNFILDFIKTCILGIIQGITEWLPISSTGHLLIFNSIWPMLPTGFFDVFKVVIQFGSIIAVCVLYFQKLNPWSASKSNAKKQETFQLWAKVIVGAIPAAILGLILDDLIDGVLSANFVIAVTLILYGIIFIIQANHPMKPTIQRIEDLDYRTAIKIGCFQCLALIPGTSRSGATILGGLYSGCSRYVASEFSFFLAIPVMLGASALKIVKYILEFGMFSFSQTVLLLVGMFVSFEVSIYAIRMLLGYVRKHNFKVFGWYRIALGIFIIVFFYIL